MRNNNIPKTKKSSPTELNQGNKDTKRKRIIQYELARKWINPTGIQTSKVKLS